MKVSMYLGIGTRANKAPAMIGLSLVLALVVGMGFASTAASFQSVSEVGTSVGAPVGGGGDSMSPVVSADGRYVLFSSSANNLALTTNNMPIPMRFPPKLNVYLRDRTLGKTTLVTVDVTGANGADGDSFPVDISTNGQYVLFESTAANLVTNATTGTNYVYVRDVINGTNILVSVNTNGVACNASCRSSAMTPDGRYVVFSSAASDLVPGDTNGIPDVFVRDLQLGVTTMVSVGAQGSTPAAVSDLPDITPNGRYVVFYSTATNLAAGATNGAGEIYVRDLVGGSTTWASAYAQSLYNQAYIAQYPTISDDGQFVAYQIAGVTNGGAVFQHSQTSGLTSLIASNAVTNIAGSELNHRALDMTPDGRYVVFIGNTNTSSTAVFRWDGWSNTIALVAGPNSIFDMPVIDPTGRYIAYVAEAPGLTSNSVGGFHLYRTDMQSGTTLLLDANSSGVASGGIYDFPCMSTDGSLIVFKSDLPLISTNGSRTNFQSNDKITVTNDNNNSYDVLAANLQSNTIELVSVANPDLPSITPNGLNTLSQSSVSANARYIAFSSEASNLVPGDTNGVRDVFVRDIDAGSNILVSIATNGLCASGFSADSAITPDGRYVAFTSFATNLAAGDTNNARDVFVRDLQMNSTKLVSVNTSSNGPGNLDSYSPTISTNGRYVLFHGFSSNLAGSNTGTNSENLYWRDTQAGITRIFTTNNTTSTGTAASGSMTPDGQYVAAVGTSGFSDYWNAVYVWNALVGTTIYTNLLPNFSTVGIGISPDGTRLGVAWSITSSGAVVALDRVAKTSNSLSVIYPRGFRYCFRFSADSRYMAFVGALGNSASQTNHIYLYDFVAKTNVLISQSTNGVPGNGNSDMPDISSDGRFIAYRSVASNLGAGATNGIPNLYLYDTVAGTTTLISGTFGRSMTPVFSADARTLVFASWDAGFGSQDFNQYSDIFTMDLYSTNVPPVFSAGIISPNRAGGLPVITWMPQSGKSYQVQFKNTLSDPVWQVLNGPGTISSNQQTMTDPAPGTQRYYRVVAH